MLEKIRATRRYLDYLERHYNNVQKAWAILKETCKDQRFVWDDYCYFEINDMVKWHDDSKMSQEEFVPYREHFYTAAGDRPAEEREEDYQLAWAHHLEVNDHHWQNWTKNEVTITSQIGFMDDIHEKKYVCKDFPYMDIFLAHMLCDWMAMSMELGGTPQEYYENNKNNIKLPDWAVRDMYIIFERIAPYMGQ